MVQILKLFNSQQFEYLGSFIDDNGDCSVDIKRILALARNVVHGMQKIWKSRMISTSLKIRILRATAFSVATYGSESWTIKKADQSRIDAFEMWSYRRVLRVSWKEKKTNIWVLEKVGSDLTLRKDISNRKMRFFGHIMRHDCLEKLLCQGMVNGKRRRGRPPKGWLDGIKEITGLTAVGATRLSENRRSWSALLVATPAHVR